MVRRRRRLKDAWDGVCKLGGKLVDKVRERITRPRFLRVPESAVVQAAEYRKVQRDTISAMKRLADATDDDKLRRRARIREQQISELGREADVILLPVAEKSSARHDDEDGPRHSGSSGSSGGGA